MKTPTMTVCNTSKKGKVKKKAKRFVRQSFTAEGKNAPIKATKMDPYTGYRENFESFQIGYGHKDIKTKKPVDTPMDFSEKKPGEFLRLSARDHGHSIPKGRTALRDRDGPTQPH